MVGRDKHLRMDVVSLKGMRYAVCGMRYVVCGMRYASMRYAVCGMWYAVCGMWYAVCGMRYAVCGMWYAVCGMRYAVCGMRYALFTGPGLILRGTGFRVYPTTLNPESLRDLARFSGVVSPIQVRVTAIMNL